MENKTSKPEERRFRPNTNVVKRHRSDINSYKVGEKEAMAARRDRRGRGRGRWKGRGGRGGRGRGQGQSSVQKSSDDGVVFVGTAKRKGPKIGARSSPSFAETEDMRLHLHADQTRGIGRKQTGDGEKEKKKSAENEKKKLKNIRDLAAKSDPIDRGMGDTTMHRHMHAGFGREEPESDEDDEPIVLPHKRQRRRRGEGEGEKEKEKERERERTVKDILREEELILFQLPSRLPFKKLDGEAEEDTEADLVANLGETLRSGTRGNYEKTAAAYRALCVPPLTPQSNTTAALQYADSLEKVHGYLGELTVWESGRTVLRMGNVDFKVVRGTSQDYGQMVVVHDLPPDNPSLDGEGEEHRSVGSSAILGHATERLVVVPNISEMLEAAKGKASRE